MTALLTAVFLLLTAVAGAAMTALLTPSLRLEERAGVAAVTGLVLSGAVCYLLSIPAGLTVASVLGGPAVVTAVALAVARISRIRPDRVWRDGWSDAVARWRRGELWSLVVSLIVLGAVLALILGRALAEDQGAIVTGYWIPDWSQHLTTVSSLTAGHNIPPQDPIFSGTTLLYPFLPDFLSAMLTTLGVGLGPALGAEQAVLCLAVCLLIITLGRRLSARLPVGLIAIAVCFIGGGLGFMGAFQDACVHHGYSADQCTLQHVVTSPVDGAEVSAGTLHDLPGIIAAQPRAYDGLLTPDAQKVFSDQQWYTPLMAWWIPQRSLVVGFASALAVLTIVLAAMEGEGRAPFTDLALAGIVAGLLPLVHVHTLFALGIAFFTLAVTRWRREWLALAAVTAIVALPRMIQLALGPHGSVSLGNQYPWLEPGWLSQAVDTSGQSHSLGWFARAFAQTLLLPFSPTFWSFWWVNLGIALPLSAAVVLAAIGRHITAVRGFAARLLAPFPAPLLRLCLAFMPVFFVANLVVFQSWDWDNTKLLVYWYLAVGYLAGALAVHLWRRWWRGVLAVALVGSMTATGALVLLRMVPWQPACGSPGAVPGHCYAQPITGPYVVVDAEDGALALRLRDETAPGAVFITSRRFNDPVPVLSGRPIVMGYDGWLWSYGIDYRDREADVATVYTGCGSTPLRECAAVLDVLRRYHVDYVEVDSQQSDPQIDTAWWASQGLPVVDHDSHIVIYDVRQP